MFGKDVNITRRISTQIKRAAPIKRCSPKVIVFLCVAPTLLSLLIMVYSTGKPTSQKVSPRSLITTSHFGTDNRTGPPGVYPSWQSQVLEMNKTIETSCFNTSPYVICNEASYDLQHPFRESIRNSHNSLAWKPVVENVPNTNYTMRNRNVTGNRGKDGLILVALYNKLYAPTNCVNSQHCPIYNNCKFASENNTPDIDVVAVVGIHLNTAKTIPRWPHQVFLFISGESPPHTGNLARGSNPWDYQFNITSTYRVDADVFSPYGWLKYKPKRNLTLGHYVDKAKRKTKVVAWIVSHCGAPSKRDDYAKELKKYIPVDIYGKCGKPCPKSPDYCGKDLNQYRFYLSFENTICDDYVTEKFFKRFIYGGVVPVVLGGAKYEKYFPPKTFINTADFKSPKLLAQFLNFLVANDVAYSQYLITMDQYELIPPKGPNPCRVCEFVNNLDFSKSQYYHLDKWLSQGHCR